MISFTINSLSHHLSLVNNLASNLIWFMCSPQSFINHLMPHANQILAVLTYGPLRESLVAQGREEIEGMRWDLRGEALRKIYQELVA